MSDFFIMLGAVLTALSLFIGYPIPWMFPAGSLTIGMLIRIVWYLAKSKYKETDL